MSKLGLMLYATCRREALLTAAAEAEERGFDSVFMNEGFGRDAISSLATIAAHTRSIRVGSAIITTPTRSAALLATTAASMTDLTGGRFILGLGTGHPERIRDQHAMQYARPTDRLNDYVNIIRRAAAGEEVNYEGKVVSVKGLKLQFSVPGIRIPIYFAALGPRTSRLAGALADGVILHLVTPSYIRDVRGWIAEGARAAGRSPDEIEVVCIAMTSLDAEPSAARRAMCRRIAFYAGRKIYHQVWQRGGFDEEEARMAAAFARGGVEAAADEVSDRMLDLLPVAATPDELQRKLAILRGAGVTLPLLFPGIADADDPLPALQGALSASGRA